MVVVAIIGVLATIAVPQFNKWVLKAKQAEAKSSLASLYTAIKGFKSLHGVYHGNFNAIGYQLEGRVRYRIGFYEPSGTALPSGIAPEVTGSARGKSPCVTADVCDRYNANVRTKKCHAVTSSATSRNWGGGCGSGIYWNYASWKAIASLVRPDGVTHEAWNIDHKKDIDLIMCPPN